MPLRLIVPFAICGGSQAIGDFIYARVRLNWYGYHRDMNNVSYKWFGTDDVDVPPPRRYDINEKHKLWGDFIKWEAYLNLRFKEDRVELTKEDPEYAKIPKMIVNNDITLKESLLEGNREKDRYIFDEITMLPRYYRRWRDRTKPERDQKAKDIANQKPIVYGAPYWNGITSADLD